MGTDKRVRAVKTLFQRRVEARRRDPSVWEGYMDPWPTDEHRFKKREANAFFIGMLLDQQIPADRAWCGGRHMARTHFQAGKNFWQEVAETNLNTLYRIMRTGYCCVCSQGHGGKSYHRTYRRMARFLKDNARIINERYRGDVRGVWVGLGAEDVDVIYHRLNEFRGIGDALAKMGQFALVRDHGVAGGERSKSHMSVKPDVHVNRVVNRLGLVSSDKPRVVARELGCLDLESPADFDLAVWHVGQQFCKKTGPDCGNCPLRRVCDFAAA